MCLTGSLLLVPLLSGILKVPDGILGIISLLGSAGSSLTVAFAVSPLMMYLCKLIKTALQNSLMLITFFYLAAIGSVLSAAIGTVYRSKISKTAEGSDLSLKKIFAAIILPLIINVS